MNKVVIGLGSNINPKKNILKASRLLSQKYKLIKKSRFIKTKAIGNKSQADFINGAILLETQSTLGELRRSLKDIEKKLGREPIHPRYGPRTMDLDIIVWNGKIIDRDFYKRKFLRQSVIELIPDLPYYRPRQRQPLC